MYTTIIKTVVSAIFGVLADKIADYFQLQRTIKDAVTSHEKERAEVIYEQRDQMDKIPDSDEHTVADSLRDGKF